MIDKIIPPIAHALMPSFTPAFRVFAQTYSGSQGNPAAFKTLENTRVSGSVAVAALGTNQGKSFQSYPVLDGYPQSTTFVYGYTNLSHCVRSITLK